MDINCTNNCVYQSEGKCTMEQLPSVTSQIQYSANTDCPYCSVSLASAEAPPAFT
jgi:hypothetical protein